MATEDLAHRARELLSMTGGSASRSLNQLVGLVSRQVPGCSGATSAVWRETEPVVRAASHPDLAELFELQLTSGSAPWLDALASLDSPASTGTVSTGTTSTARSAARTPWRRSAGRGSRPRRSPVVSGAVSRWPSGPGNGPSP